jgi:DNA-binding NarL/FixJ family response regulator
VSVRVLLVDDSALVREGLRMVLDPAPGIEVVGEAGDGAIGVAEAGRLRPDVVLMDVRMPTLDGIEATRRIVALDGPPVRVLMLTTFDLDEYLLEALRAGVSGFTLKDTPPDDLLAGILAVARDDALVDPASALELIDRITRSHPPASPPAGVAELTASERHVLERLARGRSNAEIAAELAVGEATVEAHVTGVLTKLAVRDRVHGVLVAYESRLSSGP